MRAWRSTEALGGFERPRAAGADRDARDHALQVGASGRGAVSRRRPD
jgi:hypothetical protein